jgi:transmembrane sensor
VQIVVRQGLVAMSGVGQLAAGDVGVLTSDGEARMHHAANVGDMLGWLDGRLSYRDAPLARVLDDLHRWQGAEVALRDSSLATLPFTGEIEGLSARSAVGLVAATLGLRLTRDGERWLLAPVAGRTPKAARHTRDSTVRAPAPTP